MVVVVCASSGGAGENPVGMPLLQCAHDVQRAFDGGEGFPVFSADIYAAIGGKELVGSHSSLERAALGVGEMSGASATVLCGV